MTSKLSKNIRRKFRHKRIRKKISGTSDIPRVSIYRSKKNIYAQVIDDKRQKTILHVSSLSSGIASEAEYTSSEMAGKIGVSKSVGKKLAELAKEKGIKRICFDRGGYSYHGRVKALADGLKEGGIKI